MRVLFLLFVGASIFVSCQKFTETKVHHTKMVVIPTPKEISPSTKALFLSNASRLFAEQNELLPLLSMFNQDINKLFGIKFEIDSVIRESSVIRFSIDSLMAKDQYSLEISDDVVVAAGSLNSLINAKTTLLQLAFSSEGKLCFPVTAINDYTDASYRGVMLDLARSWHSVETIKKVIDLAAYYKSNFLQLHFTDYQSYTLPSRKYPKLSTPDRHYSFEDLEDLEEYAKLRGITIIPEIDIPGHASSIVSAYPEVFGLKDIKENPWIINMGKDTVYQALDQIIGELVPIFKSSPYFHIGGDEAIFDKTMADPDVQAYMRDNNLGEDVHDLYRHFLVRINEIVKKHGKQMCVWEGFRREGKVSIPKDIVVFEFETNRYLPNHLVEDGYTVVNTSWKPLYVVNQKKWEPKTIYEWNLWRWENWFKKAPSYDPIQVKKSPLIIGAQMCSWEQPETAVFKSLRLRLPVMNERIWNSEGNMAYDEFLEKMLATDQKLSLLLDDNSQDSLLFNHNFVGVD